MKKNYVWEQKKVEMFNKVWSRHVLEPIGKDYVCYACQKVPAPDSYFKVIHRIAPRNCVYGDFFKVRKEWLCTECCIKRKIVQRCECGNGSVAIHWQTALMKLVCSECAFDFNYILQKAKL